MRPISIVKIIGIIIVLGFSGTIYAQLIDIQGTLQDGNQQSLSNCKVSLKYGLNATSGTDGSFSIEGGTPIRLSNPATPSRSHYFLKGQFLTINILERDQQVSLDLYNISGKHLVNILNEKLQQGTWKLTPLDFIKAPLRSSVIYARVTIGSESHAFKIFSIGYISGSKSISKVNDNSRDDQKSNSPGPLAKSGAKADHILIIECSGYSTKLMELSENTLDLGTISVTVPALDPSKIVDTPEWPVSWPDNVVRYHLIHPTETNRPNDPNAAFYWKGRYHLHYLYDLDGEGLVAAHVSSDDMLHWDFHPTVLAYSNMGHYIFSGTGFFTKEGEPAFVYHGQTSNKNVITYALDDNFDVWSDAVPIEPRDANGNPMNIARTFDPDIWIMDDMYYGVNGVSKNEPPTLMKSDNLNDWEHLGELMHPDFDEDLLGVSRNEDISTPNMFKIGNKWMLMGISHRQGCRYFLGDFVDEKYLPDFHARMAWADIRYFANESMLTKDGRRVMWAWYRGFTLTGRTQSLPRELSLPEDGVLRIKPLRELETLRYDELIEENIMVSQNSDQMLENIRGRFLELKIEIKNPGDGNFGVDVICNDQGEGCLRVRVDQSKNIVQVRDEWAPFKLKNNEPLTLRIFVDQMIVEVFINDRQALMRDDSGGGDRVKLFSEGSNVNFDNITAWKMNSVYDL